MLDEPTNHLDVAAIEWLEKTLAGRDPARSWWRRTTARSSTPSSGASGSCVTAGSKSFRGNYSRLPRAARGAGRPGAQGRRDTRRRDRARAASWCRRYRSHRKFSKMHEHERRLAALQEQAAAAPRKVARDALDARRQRPAGTGAIGRRRGRHRGPRVRLPGRADRPRSAPRGAARRPDRRGRAERRGQDHAAAHDRRRAGAARAATCSLGQRRAHRLPRADPRAAAPRRDGARRVHGRDRSRLRPGAQRTWRASCSAATTSSSRSRSCPAGSARASSWRSSASLAAEPAAARRADEPSRHPGARGARDVPARSARRRSSSSRTTGGCSRRVQRSCGSWSDGRVGPAADRALRRRLPRVARGRG